MPRVIGDCENVGVDSLEQELGLSAAHDGEKGRISTAEDADFEPKPFLIVGGRLRHVRDYEKGRGRPDRFMRG